LNVPYPRLMPTAGALENDLRRFEQEYDLSSDVERGTFVQRMLEHWRTENFSTLRGAAESFDIDVTPRTLHDELIKKVVGRWIKALLEHRAKPKFEVGDKVRFKIILDRSDAGITVLEADVKQVRVQQVHTWWVSAGSIEKVEEG
jgi:hypothetical protein